MYSPLYYQNLYADKGNRNPVKTLEMFYSATKLYPLLFVRPPGLKRDHEPCWACIFVKLRSVIQTEIESVTYVWRTYIIPFNYWIVLEYISYPNNIIRLTNL